MDSIEEKQYWSLIEVGELFRVSRETVRRWIAAKKIPAIKFGKTWRISDETVQQIKSGIIRVCN